MAGPEVGWRRHTDSGLGCMACCRTCLASGGRSGHTTVLELAEPQPSINQQNHCHAGSGRVAGPEVGWRRHSGSGLCGLACCGGSHSQLGPAGLGHFRGPRLRGAGPGLHHPLHPHRAGSGGLTVASFKVEVLGSRVQGGGLIWAWGKDWGRAAADLGTTRGVLLSLLVVQGEVQGSRIRGGRCSSESCRCKSQQGTGPPASHAPLWQGQGMLQLGGSLCPC